MHLKQSELLGNKNQRYHLRQSWKTKITVFVFNRQPLHLIIKIYYLKRKKLKQEFFECSVIYLFFFLSKFPSKNKQEKGFIMFLID